MLASAKSPAALTTLGATALLLALPLWSLSAGDSRAVRYEARD